MWCPVNLFINLQLNTLSGITLNRCYKYPSFQRDSPWRLVSTIPGNSNKIPICIEPPNIRDTTLVLHLNSGASGTCLSR